jgi:hypothetical protein
MKDFFISYNKADRLWAEWIAWQLEIEGYTTILQAWDIRPGANFVVDMHDALMETERLIAILSPDYLDKQAKFSWAEWAAAFRQDPTGTQRKLLPIRVRKCEPMGLLASINYIDLVNLDDVEARKLLIDGINPNRGKPTVAPSFPGRTTQASKSALATPGGNSHLLTAPPPFPKNLPLTNKTINIFYSYVASDEELRDALEKQLTLLRKTGVITDWHPGKITAGRNRAEEIEKHLQSAQIILLLISANYLASDDFDDILAQAMKRRNAGNARIIPVILRPVDWRLPQFAHLTPLPANEKAITSWSSREEAFFAVAQGIREVVDEINANP